MEWNIQRNAVDSDIRYSIMSDMDEHTQKLSSKHLETLSNRVEKVALLLLASLVVQKIFAGRGSDPSVILWLGVSLALYYLSYQLLVKS